MNYSTPTNHTPYHGALDVINFRNLRIRVHDAVTEKPRPGDLVIPICCMPGDEMPKDGEPLSDWAWELPHLYVMDAVMDEEYKVVDSNHVVLWWISTEEMHDEILRHIESSHIGLKAMFIAMQHLERLAGGNTNE